MKNILPNLSADELKARGLLIPKIGYADDIAQFVESDRKNPTKANGILFVGDSDIRFWKNDNIFFETFSDLPVTNRGFGGSRTWEVLLYFNELILPSQPKIIVYCCGDNDIAALEKSGVKNAVLGFQIFLEQIELKAPSVEKILYMGIHPSPRDEPLWPFIFEANKHLIKVCGANKKVVFTDYLHILHDSKGKIKPDYFLDDGLHFSSKCYKELGEFYKMQIKKYFNSNK